MGQVELLLVDSVGRDIAEWNLWFNLNGNAGWIGVYPCHPLNLSSVMWVFIDTPLLGMVGNLLPVMGFVMTVLPSGVITDLGHRVCVWLMSVSPLSLLLLVVVLSPVVFFALAACLLAVSAVFALHLLFNLPVGLSILFICF